MVVDDDAHIRRLAQMILTTKGHIIIEAENGEECLEKLKSEHPDLILMDAMMPGKDGWEICKAIKDHPATQSIPVLMFTVRSGKTDIEKSIKEAGADGHISKPFQVQELESQISRILNR